MYTLVRTAFFVLYRVFFRLRIEYIGEEPKTGPALLIANHASLLDPPLTVCPFKRPVYFMAKEELFRIPVLGSILSRLRVFPVRRGQADRKAIRRALEILKEGHLLAMFPEGTRSKDGRLKKAEPGAAMFALRSKAPVIPVALINTDKILKKGSFFAPLEVRVGKPVPLDEFYDQKISSAVLDEAGEKMMAALSELLDKEN